MIKEIRIYGYKKFEEYRVEFKEKVNIIVGDNESGKSTILEALNIALNRRLPFKELSALKYYFNVESVEKYFEDSNFDNLPKIYIEIDFEVESSVNIQYENFYGARFLKNIIKQDYTNKKFGILFECIPDEDFMDEIKEVIANGEIPYEYYLLSWKTYKDEPLKVKSKKPVKSYMLDNTRNLDSYSINKYSSDLFKVLKNETDQKKIKSKFFGLSDNLYSGGELNIAESRRFNILVENTNFSRYLSILDSGVLLELKGKGKERRIITELALQNNSAVDLVIIEEPEMNLSNVSLNKLIGTIEQKYIENSNTNIRQMILSTHSNLIASKLELDNIIYVGKDEAKSFNGLDSTTSQYFKKLDNNNIVDILNSDKNIIVEGASEYILLPELFKKYNKESGEENKFTLSDFSIKISSGQGVTYKHYAEILKYRGSKSIFITDNDNDEEKIYSINESEKFNVISSDSVDEWTFEVALYNSNEDKLKHIFNVESDKRVTDTYKGMQQVSKTLAYMLNNKTDVAYKLISNVDDLVIPKYICEAFEWIKN